MMYLPMQAVMKQVDGQRRWKMTEECEGEEEERRRRVMVMRKIKIVMAVMARATVMEELKWKERKYGVMKT